MKKIILLIVLFSFSVPTLITAQSKTSQKELFANTYHNSKNAVKSQHYQFVADVIHNSQEREVLNGEHNQFKVYKLQVVGQLHDFSKHKVVHVIKDDQSKIDTSFNDETQLISIDILATDYDIKIEIKPNGKAFLTLNGHDGSKLSYTGRINKL
ncbi:DUF4251 domain-containing protein [Winogradskyella sediminis]|uniref:DUF4251 domain-containing protein n=1 Tax=Winogradskyella sediminis TaxID=1382466 RepID=UPI000E233FFF|nr:DUF4251 domain-containing protein [Winogradskyella sediminis]REG86164.1 uncharacterized protein DUF4251 [Winogradskyella sediminis]